MHLFRNVFILIMLCAVFYQWAYSQGCDQPYSYPQTVSTYISGVDESIEDIYENLNESDNLDQIIYKMINKKLRWDGTDFLTKISSLKVVAIDGYSFYDAKRPELNLPICDYEVTIFLKNGEVIQEGKIFEQTISHPAYSSKRIFEACSGSFL